MTVATVRNITPREISMVQSHRDQSWARNIKNCLIKTALVGGSAFYLITKYGERLCTGSGLVKEDTCKQYATFDPAMETYADMTLAACLVSYVGDSILGGLSSLCCRSKTGSVDEDSEPREFVLKVSAQEVVLALLDRVSDTAIRELLTEGTPEVIIENIKNLFPYTSRKTGQAIEEGPGRSKFSGIFNSTIDVMRLRPSRDSKTFTGILHPKVTKDDLIQMIIATRMYGLEPQANALENYATSLRDSRKVTKREIQAEVQELAKRGLTKI